MSFLREVAAVQNAESIRFTPCERCLNSTIIKIGLLVLGLLLIGAGLTIHFLNVNLIEAYVTIGAGGADILGVVIWSIINWLQSKNKKSEDISHGPDLSKIASNLEVAENNTLELIKMNRSMKTQLQSIYAGIQYAESYTTDTQNLIVKAGWEEEVILEIDLTKKQNLDVSLNNLNEIIDNCSARSIIVFFCANGQCDINDGTIRIRLVTLVKTHADVQ